MNSHETPPRVDDLFGTRPLRANTKVALMRASPHETSAIVMASLREATIRCAGEPGVGTRELAESGDTPRPSWGRWSTLRARGQNTLARSRVLFLLEKGTDVVLVRRYQQSYPEPAIEPVWCFDPKLAPRLLEHHAFDVVVTYVTDGGPWRPHLVRRLRRAAADTPFVLLATPAAERADRPSLYSGMLTTLSLDSLSTPAFGLCLTFARMLRRSAR